MLKVVGFVTIFGAVVLGTAYFFGYLTGNVSVKITDQGHQAIQDAERMSRDAASSGLRQAADMVEPAKNQ